MYAARARDCEDCGKAMVGRFPPDKPVRCVDCNIKRATDAAFSMRNKSGPYYDRWVSTRGPQGRPRTDQ